jgi:hypothetical protein
MSAAPVTRRPDWFPRAIISGFVATLAMAILFFIAYGAAYALSSGIRFGPLGEWLRALTTNPVLNLAAASVYAAATVHLIIGIVFAVIYAYVFEPRGPGMGAVRGMWFALIPWALSVAIFLPLVGGGFFGSAIGAGPLPALGNLILHLVYGATLGAVYGPLGDVPADELSMTAPTDSIAVVRHYENTSARGILLGSILGGIVGAAIAIYQGLFGATPAEATTIAGLPPLLFVPLTAAIGLVLGALWGSIAGLTPGRVPAPGEHIYTVR